MEIQYSGFLYRIPKYVLEDMSKEILKTSREIKKNLLTSWFFLFDKVLLNSKIGILMKEKWLFPL
jgi:hypothetical protein